MFGRIARGVAASRASYKFILTNRYLAPLPISLLSYTVINRERRDNGHPLWRCRTVEYTRALRASRYRTYLQQFGRTYSVIGRRLVT